MAEKFSIPEEYEIPFRRLLPYLMAPLQNDPKVLESIVLYYKLGGDKMARVVIDALNATRRLEQAELIKRLKAEAMLKDSSQDDDDDEEKDDENDEDDEKDGDDD